MRVGLMAVLLALTVSSVAADDCVVLVGAHASTGPESYAYAGGISASIYPTVEDCNRHLVSLWHASLDYFAANGMGIIESSALECVVPVGCTPPDARDVKPDSRTIFPFIVENLR